jgi:aquaporin NIP
MKPITRHALAELMGTFALVFAGCGAIVINQVSGGAITHPGIALTFGFIVLTLIYALGDISGAHLNPAVTINFWLAGRFERTKVLPYILAQTAGAILACLLLRFLFPTNPTLGTTLPAGSAIQSFILECVMTWLLMLVILNVSTGAKEKGITAGIAIGSVIALEAMFGGPISGASMNPARSLGPALVSGNFQHLWVYLLAPTLGGALAILCFSVIREPGNQQQASETPENK